MANCLVCGIEFVPKHSSVGKYCSRECFYAANKGSVHKRKYSDVICPTCGKVFYPKRRPGRMNYYCSKECAGQVAPEKACSVCGSLFRVTCDRKVYCSNDCMIKARKKYESKAEATEAKKLYKSAWRKAWKERTAPEREAKATERKLISLERKKQREAERKAERKAEAEHRRIERMHPCAVCGMLTDRPKYCSDACSKKTAHSRKEQRRRAMIRNVLVDKDITLAGVYQKDMGLCYLCGRICSWNDYKVENETTICGQTYPSIDHVIPLSKGGKHSWTNVRLACRKCNSIKSDSTPRHLKKIEVGGRAPGGESLPSPGKFSNFSRKVGDYDDSNRGKAG